MKQSKGISDKVVEVISSRDYITAARPAVELPVCVCVTSTPSGSLGPAVYSSETEMSTIKREKNVLGEWSAAGV
jgi:hypothetical protein